MSVTSLRRRVDALQNQIECPPEVLTNLVMIYRNKGAAGLPEGLPTRVRDMVVSIEEFRLFMMERSAMNEGEGEPGCE